MNVKQLKEKLSEYPDHMDVFMDERLTDFRFGLLNSVTSREIPFSEDPDGPELSRDTVVILSED